MHLLSRTVRFAINPPELRATGPDAGANGFAGSPPFRGLARHYEIEVICEGSPDPVTGYLIDIKDVDRGVRSAVVPQIQQTCDSHPNTEPAVLLPAMVAALGTALPRPLRSLRWKLTPYYSVQMNAAE